MEVDKRDDGRLLSTQRGLRQRQPASTNMIIGGYPSKRKSCAKVVFMKEMLREWMACGAQGGDNKSHDDASATP